MPFSDLKPVTAKYVYQIWQKEWDETVMVSNKFHEILPKLPDKPPQWGAADAEIKVPSGENTELKRSPFKAWSMSTYSHTCYAYRA